MNSSQLEVDYRRRLDAVLGPLADALQNQLTDYLRDVPRIDRVVARPKSVDRFLAKAAALNEEGKPKYVEPLNQIQDQVGARVIGLYLSDVDSVSKTIEKYYHPIETRDVVPDSQWKFGYFGKHFILLVPKGLVSTEIDKELVPRFFELQIKTLFQHAWSEANHDLGYKPASAPLGRDDERALAFTSAQAWGADRMFDDLHRSLVHQ
ncbi:MAG TPA: RelA/SpoT domain-containing protein [Rhizomicrobium sp.]|jgi:ppGpp synthetase/RelA/SpoT-type nucleotidyltranferase|nr:RelA/SpoT domain-containing protein [Rhizomicrobium sp.]